MEMLLRHQLLHSGKLWAISLGVSKVVRNTQSEMQYLRTILIPAFVDRCVHYIDSKQFIYIYQCH